MLSHDLHHGRGTGILCMLIVMRDAEKLKVKDLMSREVYTINLEQTWAEAARKMAQKDIHHLVIVDGDHRPVGVISAFDFIRFARDTESRVKNTALKDTRPHDRLITIDEDDHLYDAVNTMNIRGVEALVVLSKNKGLAGVLTARDVMNVIFA